MDIRSARPVAARQRGVTLVELMVTMTVLGIVLALGVPSLSRIIASNRLASQSNELVSALNLARSEAVRRAQPVALRSSAGTHEFAGGWTVFTDADADGAIPGTVTAKDGTVLRVLGSTAAGTTIKRVTRSESAPYTYTEATSSMADRMYVVFNSRGGNERGRAFFKICDSGNSAVKGRIVQVSVVGRISLDSSSEDC